MGKLFDKEPSYIIGLIVMVINLILMIVTGDPNNAVEAPTDIPEQGADWTVWVSVLSPLVAAAIIRFKVFAPNTLREAGLSPKQVERDAKNPKVLPANGRL